MDQIGMTEIDLDHLAVQGGINFFFRRVAEASHPLDARPVIALKFGQLDFLAINFLPSIH